MTPAEVIAAFPDAVTDDRATHAWCCPAGARALPETLADAEAGPATCPTHGLHVLVARRLPGTGWVPVPVHPGGARVLVWRLPGPDGSPRITWERPPAYEPGEPL